MELIVSIATLSSGGAERVLSILSYQLINHFESVTFILWKQSDIFYEISDRVKILNIEETLGSKSELKKMRWFRSYIKKRPDSVVLSFLYPYNMRVLLSTVGLSNKIVIAERRDGNLIKGGKIVRFLRNKLYRKATKIILQTKSNIKNYPSYIKSKVAIIPNPIKFDKHLVGKSLSIQQDKLIVSVGRLIEEKNHKFLIETFKDFLQFKPDYTLIIYGEGPLRRNLESYINEHDLRNKVLLPGNVKNIEEYVSQAEIFVLSSNSEGMPNALFEAMALGLACISTKVNGAIDYIQNGVNGLLIKQNDKKSLLDALITLSSDRDFSQRLGTQASNIASELETEKICKMWIDILKK